MALDITAQDLIVDESTGLQDDDTSVSNNTVAYLLSLDSAGGLSSPQVAVQTDFVIASADANEVISSVALARNATGDPFSTSVGINSGIQTVDGNWIWLFQDAANSNVVIGVIGTDNENTMPAADGELAFSFALISTSATHYDLYVAQYVPLMHPDPTKADDDLVDLTDMVYASVSATTTVNFSQLGDAPPGHNKWYILDADVASTQKILVTAHDNGVQAEVNVSTQGLGVSSQDVRVGRELQIDLISGGTQSAGKNFTNTPLAPDYVAHLENISSAGFSVSQSTPTNSKADIEIHAYNNDDNAEGAAFPTDDNDAEINITGVTFKLNGVTTTAADLGITVDLSGTGLILRNVGLGVTVDFTTAGGAGGTFDRFTIKNIDGDKDYFDVKEVHYSGQTPNAYTEQVGSFINFDDDGPTLSITAAPTVGAAEVTEASGVGGQSQATITAPTFNAGAVDGYTSNVSYALSLAGTATGLVTTAGNHAITLVLDSASQISGMYDSNGDTTLDATAFTVTLSGSTVTLTSLVALEHANAPQGVGEDNTLDLSGLITVVATVTVTDGDEDVISTQSSSTALSLIFNDTDPTLSITAAPTVGAAEVTEASGVGGQSQATITAPTFNAGAVDGYTSNVSYALSLAGTATGLVTTAGNHAITLVLDSASQISGMYDSDGDTTLDATAFTVTLSGSTVTLTSLVALEHANAPQGAGEDNTLDLSGLITVVATVTVTDGDEDVISSQSSSSALSLVFNDTDPTLSITAAPTVGAAEVTEASGVGGQSQATITAPSFNAGAVDGYTSNVSYALSLAGTATGLVTTAGNHAITLVLDSASQISGMYDSDGDTTLDATAFTVTLSGSTVTLTSLVALEHANAPQGVGEDNTLDLSGLITVVATVTVTDGDEDVISTQSSSTALSLVFNDTDPVVTVPYDADPSTAGIQTVEQLANVAGQTASGAFGYGMTDLRSAAEFTAGGSDFVDVDPNTSGVQIALTGTVDNDQNANITQAIATLITESLSSATFNFSFHYDKDPITAGVQDATAGGTLVFDKVNDTYTITLNDVIDGFSFDVLHTQELVAKQPTGNTGHPLIVAEQLTQNGDPDPFFVQFTANSIDQKTTFGFNLTGDGASVGDTTFNNQGATHDLITSAIEDWVSATQSTNGVAGDTIQKGELLTLRFFEENILGDVNPAAAGGGTERLDPTANADGIVIKFDGIGSTEDLVVILDLIDENGNEITRAVNVENGDLIRGNANVPSPYNGEFTLDNNDALLIIEHNDYNVTGETYKIQGIQIMQSANGLTGTAIDLDGSTGENGGSDATSNLTAWDPSDNDVLKIVDIGFVQESSGTIGADLQFAFNITDGDGDFLALQQINVAIA